MENLTLEVFTSKQGYDNYKFNGQLTDELKDYLKMNGYLWSRNYQCYYPASPDARTHNKEFTEQLKNDFFSESNGVSESTKINKEMLNATGSLLETMIQDLLQQVKLQNEKIAEIEKKLAEQTKEHEQQLEEQKNAYEKKLAEVLERTNQSAEKETPDNPVYKIKTDESGNYESLEKQDAIPELKTYHTLKKDEVENLEIVSDEEFEDIVDSIILNDYKNIPNSIRLPNLNEQLAEKLGLEKDSALILKKNATHIRPDRKGGYGQAFDTEEYRKIPEVLRKAEFAVVDTIFQNFQIVFDDENDGTKINKLVFNKDELGNYLVTLGKVDRESAFSEKRNTVIAVGVAPTIQTLRTSASSTALRASTTTADANISQTENLSNDTTTEKETNKNEFFVVTESVTFPCNFAFPANLKGKNHNEHLTYAANFVNNLNQNFNFGDECETEIFTDENGEDFNVNFTLQVPADVSYPKEETQKWKDNIVNRIYELYGNNNAQVVFDADNSITKTFDSEENALEYVKIKDVKTFDMLTNEQQEEVLSGYRSSDDPLMLDKWQNELQNFIIQHNIEDKERIAEITDVELNPPSDEWIENYIKENNVNFNTEYWNDIFAENEAKIKASQNIATNYVLEKLKTAGIEVITDKEEFERILSRENVLQKMQGTLSEDEQNRYFQFNEEDTQKFIAQVNDWQKDNTNMYKMVIVGNVPPVMKILGIKENLIEVQQSTLDKMVRDNPLYPNDLQGHKLSVDDVYAIPSQLADPVMVFKSRTRADSFVFFTERKDSNNNSILIPMAVNKRKGRIVINEITSMYGKDNEVDFVKTNFDEDNLIYLDKARSNEWVENQLEKEKSSNGERFTKVQFLGQRFTDIETYNVNILTKERLVNFISADSRSKPIQKMTDIEKAPAEVVTLYMRVSKSASAYANNIILKSKFVNNLDLFLYAQNGETYGFTFENKIYLNPEIMNSNVAVHEYTHLWDEYTKRTNPELWNKGKHILKNTYLWEEIKNSSDYADIADNEDLLASEVHSRICGQIAQSVLERIAKENGEITKDAVIDWDKEVQNYIEENFSGERYRSDGTRIETKGYGSFGVVVDVNAIRSWFSQPIKDLMNGRNIFVETNENSNNLTESNNNLDSLIEEEKRKVQQKIAELKEEFNNADYPTNEIDEANQREYISRLENLTDEDFRNIVQWKQDTQKDAAEAHKTVVEHYEELRRKENEVQAGELFSAAESKTVITVKNNETGRETAIQPSGNLLKNVMKLGRLKNLTEANLAVEKINAAGLEIVSTESRIILYDDEKFYDFNDVSSWWNYEKQSFEYDFDSRNLNSWDFKKFVDGNFKITRQMQDFLKIENKQNSTEKVSENSNISYFVKSTAEFEQFEDFDAITGLSADEAVKKYAEFQQKNISCGIGININNDSVFDDKDAIGGAVLIRNNGKDTLNIFGDTFVRELHTGNDHSRNVIAAFENLYNAAKKAGLDIEDASYIAEKKTELFDEEVLTQAKINVLNSRVNNADNSDLEPLFDEAFNFSSFTKLDFDYLKHTVESGRINTISSYGHVKKGSLRFEIRPDEKNNIIVSCAFPKADGEYTTIPADFSNGLSGLSWDREAAFEISKDEILKAKFYADFATTLTEKIDNYVENANIPNVNLKKLSEGVWDWQDPELIKAQQLEKQTMEQAASMQSVPQFDTIDIDPDVISKAVDAELDRIENSGKGKKLEENAVLKNENVELELTEKDLAIFKAVAPRSQYIATLQFINESEESDFFKGKVKDIVSKVQNAPALYETDGAEEHNIVLRYFHPSGTEIFISEIGKDGREAFGYQVLNGDYTEAEFGYIDIDEVKSDSLMELDYHIPEGMSIERFLYNEAPDEYPQYAKFAEANIEENKTEAVDIEQETPEQPAYILRPQFETVDEKVEVITETENNSEISVTNEQENPVVEKEEIKIPKVYLQSDDDIEEAIPADYEIPFSMGKREFAVAMWYIKDATEENKSIGFYGQIWQGTIENIAFKEGVSEQEVVDTFYNAYQEINKKAYLKSIGVSEYSPEVEQNNDNASVEVEPTRVGSKTKSEIDTMPNPWFASLSDEDKAVVLLDMRTNPDFIGEYQDDLNKRNIKFNLNDRPPKEWLLARINHRNYNGEYSYFNENNEEQKRHYEELIERLTTGERKNTHFDLYSEEFISKFGDWEKANRLEKLKNSNPIVITGEEIPFSEDLKEYKKNAISYGKSLRGEYINTDSDVSILLTTNKKNGGIYEILEHDYKDIEHLQSIAAIPQIIEKSIYVSSQYNEDVQKHPNIKSYDYYLCGLKISGEDYTVKAVISNTVDGQRYYDHKLTDIEKGLLLDKLSQLMNLEKSEQSLKNYSVPNSSVSISTQTPESERYLLKDKRLYQICQVPQMPYLEMKYGEWLPTIETAKKVMEGTLFVEKDENGVQILHDTEKGIVIGQKLSDFFKKKTEENFVEETANAESSQIPVETEPTRVGSKTKSEIKNIREQCREILKKPDNEITQDDKAILAQYEGAGGIKEDNRTENGVLNEFYTPNNLVQKVWKIVDAYAPDAVTVLEPSAGVGHFAENRPNNQFTMHEIDATSARINRILHPDAKIIEGAYQEQFFDENKRALNPDFVQSKYDVVIGNPPYGKNDNEWAGKGEGKEFDRAEEYFISKGLDALKDKNSVLAYVVPSGFLNSSNDKQKRLIAEKGELIDAYRLPEGTFGTTDVGTDIIVMKSAEKGTNVDIETRASLMYSNNWFSLKPNKVLGNTVEYTDKWGKPATKVVCNEGLTVQDELNRIDSFVTEIEAAVKTEKELFTEQKKENTSGIAEFITDEIKENITKFRTSLNDYFEKGIRPENDRFVIGETPLVLQKTGSDITEVTVPVSVIKKAVETHGLSQDEIFNSLEKMYNPVLVFDSDKDATENKVDSKLILTDVFKDENPVAVAVNTNDFVQEQQNGHRKQIEVQNIRSVHDRNVVAKNGTDLIQKWTNDGLCRYVDDKKISDWSTIARVQFPVEVLQSDNNNILTKSALVNDSKNKNLQDLLITALEIDSVKLPVVDYSYQNYDVLFSQGLVETPIETLKMGNNQFQRFNKPDRDYLLAAAYQTLTTPSLIFDSMSLDSKDGELKPVRVYGKAFYRENKDKSRAVESVVIFREENNIVIGTHNKDFSRFVKQIKTADQIIYADKTVSQLCELVNNGLAYVRTEGENTQSLNPKYNESNLLSIEKLIQDNRLTINGIKKENVEHNQNVLEQVSATENKEKTTEETFEKPAGKVMSTEEFSHYYGRTYNETEVAIWQSTDWQGIINPKKLTFEQESFIHNSQDYVEVKRGEYMHKAIFASGDIYKKISAQDYLIQTASNDYERELYTKNKELLMAAKKKDIPLADIHLTLKSTLAEEYTVERFNSEGVGEKLNLQEAFILWAKNESLDHRNWRWSSVDYTSANISRDDFPENIWWGDIVNYIDGEIIKAEKTRAGWNQTEEEVKALKQQREAEANEKRQARKDTADKLFDRFIHNGLFKEEAAAFAFEYNKRFNSFVAPDYSKLPLYIDGMSTYKGASPFKLYQQQIKGASFLCNKGNGLLAYDVGVGKTATGIVATINQIQSGRAKRPLVIVPKAVYTKWVNDFKELFPNVPINALGNLGDDFVKPYLDKSNPHSLNIPEGSVSVITETDASLGKITFTDESISGTLFEDFSNLMSVDFDGDNSDRENAANSAKIKAVIGAASRVNKQNYYFFENCGWDNLTVDEAHRFKNLWVKPTANNKRESNEFAGIPSGSTPSKKALKLFAMSQLVQAENNGSNVFLLTATPFTNSPLEVYSMLSYIARERLHEAGIPKLRDFLNEFAQTKFEMSVDSNNAIKHKQVMKSWKALPALQGILREFIDKVDADEVKGLVRPYKVQHKVALEMTPLQKQLRQADEDLMATARGGNLGATLVAMTNMRINTIAPALANPVYYPNIKLPPRNQMVETSPKLKFVCDTVADMYSNGNQDKGQFIYLPLGKEAHGYIKTYLVEKKGIPADAIEIINGDINNQQEKKDAITKKFNDPKEKLKILIGGQNTSEGIDLNGNSFVMYNCSLGWNPSETVQAEGRIHRQGNLQGVVHTVYPLINDSIDSVLFEKHSQKKARIDQLFKAEGSEVEVEDTIDPEKLKIELIKDPIKRAALIESEASKDIRIKLSKVNLKISSFEEIAEANIRLKSAAEEQENEVLSAQEREKDFLIRGLDVPSYIKENTRYAKEELRKINTKLQRTEEKLNALNLKTKEERDSYLHNLNEEKHGLEKRIENFRTEELPKLLQELEEKRLEEQITAIPPERQSKILQADILGNLRPMEEVREEVMTNQHIEMLTTQLKEGAITQEDFDIYKAAGWKKYDEYLSGEITFEELKGEKAIEQIQKTVEQKTENIVASVKQGAGENTIENADTKKVDDELSNMAGGLWSGNNNFSENKNDTGKKQTEQTEELQIFDSAFRFRFNENKIDPELTPEQLEQAQVVRNKIIFPHLNETQSGMYKAFNDFATGGVFDIVGKSIDMDGDYMTVTGVKQLQSAMEIYRNKNFETFRYIMIDRTTGEIADQLAVSSCMPNSSSIDDKAHSVLKSVIQQADVNNYAVVIAHNHPSGKVEPSLQDRETTKAIEQALMENNIDFAGHIILDHSTFSFYDPKDRQWSLITNIDKSLEQDKFVKQDFVLKEDVILNSVDLTNVAKKINDNNNWNDNFIPIVFTNSNEEVSGVKLYDKSFFERFNAEVIRNRMQFNGLEVGASKAYPIVTNAFNKTLSLGERKNFEEKLTKLVEGNAFTDVALPKGKTLAAKQGINTGKELYSQKNAVVKGLQSTFVRKVDQNIFADKTASQYDKDFIKQLEQRKKSAGITR